jgi:hypothetical protein
MEEGENQGNTEKEDEQEEASGAPAKKPESQCLQQPSDISNSDILLNMPKLKLHLTEN